MFRRHWHDSLFPIMPDTECRKHRFMIKIPEKSLGFTLVELVIVIVIMGILAAVAAKHIGPALESGKIEEAKKELDALAMAIVGNPELHNSGTRSSFGYVGDNGALPPNLNALVIDPGLATWRGPYLNNSFGQNPGDFKTDPWQSEYTLNGVSLVSVGSGSNIVCSIAGTSAELLLNRVTGNVYDIDGTPPGHDYKDSLTIRLSVPDGAGAVQTKIYAPDIGGYFAFDSIPIGRHNIEIIYSGADDTLARFVTVTPNSTVYAEYRLNSNYWQATATEPFMFHADFDSDEDGFVYLDDAFRATAQPAYAAGSRISSGGYSGGALRVNLGNINNSNIIGMSGGWSRTISFPTAVNIRLTFRYNLSQTNQYESDEYSQILLSVDGTLHGTSPHDYIAQVAGDGPGGPAPSTGWRLFQVDLGMLGAGEHIITIGGYNNKKNHVNEATTVLIDNVILMEI